MKPNFDDDDTGSLVTGRVATHDDTSLVYDPTPVEVTDPNDPNFVEPADGATPILVEGQE